MPGTAFAFGGTSFAIITIVDLVTDTLFYFFSYFDAAANTVETRVMKTICPLQTCSCRNFVKPKTLNWLKRNAIICKIV